MSIALIFVCLKKVTISMELATFVYYGIHYLTVSRYTIGYSL